MGKLAITGGKPVAILRVIENIEELRGLEHRALKSQGMSRADRES
jgi:hypothetical protein